MALSLSSFPSTFCHGHGGDEGRDPTGAECVRPHRTRAVIQRQSHRLGHALNNGTSSSSSSSSRRLRTVVVTTATEGSRESEEKVPSWAKPDTEEPPPWARDDVSTTQQGFEIPFFVYLLASAITAIAAIGSVFEYVNKKPVFGVLSSDSVFYTPLLGFFAITGIPTSAFLWFKSVQAANKEAEEQDRRDGFL